MIVPARFAYPVRARRARQRGARQMSFLGSTSVEIREMHPDDAPVAFRVRAAPSQSGPIELRWSEGRVWWPLREERQTSPLLAQKWLAQIAEGDHDALQAISAIRHYPASKDWPTAEMGEDVIDVEKDGRDEVEAYLRRQTSSLMICGGTVWFPGTDPIYRVMPKEYDVRGIACSAEVVVPCRPHLQPFEHRNAREWGIGDYRADQGHDAYDRRDAIIRSHGGDPQGARYRLIEVLVPEAVRADLATPALRQGVDKVLALVTGNALRINGAGDLEPLLSALKDAWRRDDNVAADLIPPLTGLLDAIGRHPKGEAITFPENFAAARRELARATKDIARGRSPSGSSTPDDDAAIASLG